MKTMKWLLRREFWENKGAFLWAPLIVSGVMIFFLVLTLVLGHSLSTMQIHLTQNGQTAETVASGTQLFGTAAEKFAQGIGENYMWFSTPIFVIAGFVIFFYCLNALYDDRRDRSILFWKSLPVSDRNTVLSKLVTALVVGPLIAIAIAIIVSSLAVLMGCIAFMLKGLNVFGIVYSSPDLYLAPFEVLALLPVYILWALPTAGWLLMVSAWARSKVFLWATGVPVLSIVLIAWINTLFGLGWQVGWYAKNVVGRLLLGVFPGNWTGVALQDGDQNINLNQAGPHGIAQLFRESWTLAGSVELWLGVIAGVAMIVAAIQLRRWSDDS